MGDVLEWGDVLGWGSRVGAFTKLTTVWAVLFSQHRAVVYMLYGVLAVLSSMGLVYLMIILSHCLVLYSVALAKQKWLCYVAGLCCLASFKVEPFSSWQVGAVSVCLISSPLVSLSVGLPPRKTRGAPLNPGHFSWLRQSTHRV